LGKKSQAKMTASSNDRPEEGTATSVARGNRTLPRAKRVAFSTIMLLVTWGVLEGLSFLYLRWTRGYDGKHLYEFDFDPYKNILPARNYVDTRGVRHNSQGFRRDSEVPRTKPVDTYRIFVMGGSTAYGIGGLWKHIQRDFEVIDNSQTIDAHLERKLSAAFPGRKFEVINAAITSTWTHHHLIYVNQTILRFDPDMILFLDGFNDFLFTDPNHDQFDDYTYNLPSRTIMGEPTLGSLAYGNAWWVFRKTPLGYVAGRAVKNAGLLLRRPGPAQAVDVAERMAGLRQAFPLNALKMHRRIGLILKDEGVIPVFLLQPMLILERSRKPMGEMERKLLDFNVSSYAPGFGNFLDSAVVYLAAAETAMAQEIGARFLDLTPIFSSQAEQMYTDYAHLTPAGNARLAAVLVDSLAGAIRADLDGRCPAGVGSPACR
jgi:lysophospholipase L1-like esterase